MVNLMSEATLTMEDVARAAATGGVLITDDATFSGEIPEVTIPETTPAAAPETGKPAGPSTESVQGSTPATTQPVAPVPTQQESQPAAAVSDWRDEIKKTDITEVLKVLGLDDKTTGLIQTWRSGGDMTNYLRAATVDYSKMSAEEIMRHALKTEFPDVAAEDFELLVQDRIREKYKLDPDLFDEKARKLGQVLLNADANRERQKLIASQQQYVLDAKPPAPAGPTPEQQAEKTQQARTFLKTEILKNPMAAGIARDKKVTIGDGEEAFSWEVKNPDELFDSLGDQQKWMSKVFEVRKVDGQDLVFPNAEKQTLIALIGEYGMGFISAYGKHMRALGAKQALEPIDNASRPGPAAASGAEPELGLYESFARNGKLATA